MKRFVSAVSICSEVSVLHIHKFQLFSIKMACYAFWVPSYLGISCVKSFSTVVLCPITTSSLNGNPSGHLNKTGIELFTNPESFFDECGGFRRRGRSNIGIYCRCLPSVYPVRFARSGDRIITYHNNEPTVDAVYVDVINGPSRHSSRHV